MPSSAGQTRGGQTLQRVSDGAFPEDMYRKYEPEFKFVIARLLLADLE